jgi:4-amino-4-deoxy-L-arabinose transferase-like glycosyltransferase
LSLVASADSTRAGPVGRLPQWTAAFSRASDLARRIPLLLALLLGLAIALRAAVWLAYSPAIMTNSDTPAYLHMAGGEMFSDGVRTAGYSMLLRATHWVWSDMELVVFLQHVLGIATALLLYAAVRRIGAPVWVSAAAAAAVLLSLDQVALEHTLVSEPLFTFLFVAALYASVRTLDEPRRLRGPLTDRHAWIVTAGALLGLAAWTRAVAAPLVPFLALWILLAIPGAWRERLARAGLVAAAAAAVLLTYFSLNAASTGHFGLARATGWALYARTAEFADCTEFAPPDGTRPLCQSTDPDVRPGPDFYTWQADSPAQRHFGYPPAGNDQLAAFGREAILHQPVSYARVALQDLARYFVPDINSERPFGGPSYVQLDVDFRNLPVEESIHGQLNGYYHDEPLVVSGAIDTLGEIQRELRVHPFLMIFAVALAATGIWLSRGRVRAGLVLLLGAALLLLIIPSAIGTYNARYAIPMGGPLIAAGAIGLWLLVQNPSGQRRA